MARAQVGLAASDYQFLPDLLFLENSGDITSMDPTQFIYTNSHGDTVTVTGAGFTYAAGKATGGTISSVVVTNGAGTLVTFDQLNDPLTDFFDQILDGNPFGALRDLFDGADQLLGSPEKDVLGAFSPGDDIVSGQGGNDHIIGDEGNDSINEDAGSSFNTLAYTEGFFDDSLKKGVKIDVAKGTAKDPWGDTDTFSNIDSFWGSDVDDKMLGSSGRDEFIGLRGEDFLNGKSNFDRADYSFDTDFPGKGNKEIKADLAKGEIKDGFGDIDTLKSMEAVRGTAVKDVFKGSNKDDEFDGYAGKDKYDGGKGFDFLVFFSNNFKGGGSGVSVDIGKGKVLDDGWGNAEKFKGMESFVGTDFADTFIGSKRDDEIKGENGNDTMTGGKGADTFVFNAPPDSVTNHDIITDFNEAQGDRFVFGIPDSFPQLNEVDGGLDPSQFVANAGGVPTNSNQRVVYDTSTGKLFIDPNGNTSSGDQILVATLTSKPTITVEAFEVWF